MIKLKHLCHPPQATSTILILDHFQMSSSTQFEQPLPLPLSFSLSINIDTYIHIDKHNYLQPKTFSQSKLNSSFALYLKLINYIKSLCFYMARLSMLLPPVFVLLIICYYAPSLEARKILKMEDNLVLLPKGTTAPPSSPSAEDLQRVTNQSLFSLHLAKIDRILQSVPSPGAGH